MERTSLNPDGRAGGFRGVRRPARWARRRVALLMTAALVVAPAPRAAAQTPAGGSEPGAPGGTRLLFGPTGRMLEPGRGYVAADGLLLTSVNVGVTPWFSFGAGTVPLGGGRLPYWVIPKVRLYSGERTNVALCVAHAAVSLDAGLGVAYVVSTTGTADQAFTIGAAVAYLVDDNDTGEDYTGAAPALLLGLQRRIHPRWSLVTESYLTTDGGVAALGFRLQRRQFMLDLDVVAPFVFGEGAFVFPAVSLGWKF